MVNISPCFDAVRFYLIVEIMSLKIYATPIKQYAYDIQFYNISLYLICYHLKILAEEEWYVLCDIYEFQWQICIFWKFHEFTFRVFFCFRLFFICIFQFEWQQLYCTFLCLFWTFLYIQVGRHVSVVTFMRCWYCTTLFGGCILWFYQSFLVPLWEWYSGAKCK